MTENSRSVLAKGLKKECEKTFGGQRNLFLDCGSSSIDTYICQNSLNCTLEMDAIYYVCMSVLYVS